MPFGTLFVKVFSSFFGVNSHLSGSRNYFGTMVHCYLMCCRTTCCFHTRVAFPAVSYGGCLQPKSVSPHSPLIVQSCPLCVCFHNALGIVLFLCACGIFVDAIYASGPPFFHGRGQPTFWRSPARVGFYPVRERFFLKHSL